MFNPCTFSDIAYLCCIGNHEYDYHTGSEKHKHHHNADPSGAERPYDPEWGNYGEQLFPVSVYACGIT